MLNESAFTTTLLPAVVTMSVERPIDHLFFINVLYIFLDHITAAGLVLNVVIFIW